VSTLCEKVVKDYKAKAPLREIEATYHIGREKLYRCLREQGVKPTRYRPRDDRNARISEIPGEEERACCNPRCGELFTPYIIDGQSCTRLCLKCFRKYSTARQAIATDEEEGGQDEFPKRI
jgi:hypothetical protein